MARCDSYICVLTRLLPINYYVWFVYFILNTNRKLQLFAKNRYEYKYTVPTQVEWHWPPFNWNWTGTTTSGLHPWTVMCFSGGMHMRKNSPCFLRQPGRFYLSNLLHALQKGSFLLEAKLLPLKEPNWILKMYTCLCSAKRTCPNCPSISGSSQIQRKKRQRKKWTWRKKHRLQSSEIHKILKPIWFLFDCWSILINSNFIIRLIQIHILLSD